MTFHIKLEFFFREIVSYMIISSGEKLINELQNTWTNQKIIDFICIYTRGVLKTI